MAMNWSKIISKFPEAFGRAYSHAEGKGKGAEVIRESETFKTLAGGKPELQTKESVSFGRGKEIGRHERTEAEDLARDMMLEEAGPEARKLYEAYDFDHARSYGPNSAYRKALEDTGLEGEAGVPQDMSGFQERYGFDIEEGPVVGERKVRSNISKMEEERGKSGLEDAMEEKIGYGAEDITNDEFRVKAKDMPFNDKIDELDLEGNRESMSDDFRGAIIDAIKRNGGADKDASEIVDEFIENYKLNKKLGRQEK